MASPLKSDIAHYQMKTGETMKTRLALTVVVCLLLIGLSAEAGSISTVLPIPARLQWDNNNGYCGECSIQTCALYFGAYVSQYQCRAIIDPTQKQDLWIGDHDATVLTALRMTYDQWDATQATPQYQKYLAWTKNHLHQGHPVIITLYVAEEEDDDYDHIVPAIGFQSSYDWTTYHAGDKLTFYDNYEKSSYIRTFSTLYDTRAMENNGADNEYCIPQDVDYGCAMTGIRDDNHETFPVRLSVNRWDEPNVTLGKSPVTLTAQVRISSLTPGKYYTLLRYDDYRKIPTKNFLASTYTRATTFKATTATRTFSDQFMSNGIVTYRCVLSKAQNAVKAGLWTRYQ